MYPEERLLHKRFGARRRLHAARASMAVNTTDLQQELSKAHLPLVETRWLYLRWRLLILMSPRRNRICGAFDPDGTSR
jgi:hypothetical protein